MQISVGVYTCTFVFLVYVHVPSKLLIFLFAPFYFFLHALWCSMHVIYTGKVYNMYMCTCMYKVNTGKAWDETPRDPIRDIYLYIHVCRLHVQVYSHTRVRTCSCIVDWYVEAHPDPMSTSCLFFVYTSTCTCTCICTCIWVHVRSCDVSSQAFPELHSLFCHAIFMSASG